MFGSQVSMLTMLSATQSWLDDIVSTLLVNLLISSCTSRANANGLDSQLIAHPFLVKADLLLAQLILGFWMKPSGIYLFHADNTA